MIARIGPTTAQAAPTRNTVDLYAVESFGAAAAEATAIVLLPIDYGVTWPEPSIAFAAYRAKQPPNNASRLPPSTELLDVLSRRLIGDGLRSAPFVTRSSDVRFVCPAQDNDFQVVLDGCSA
jgi:hypothetical protein